MAISPKTHCLHEQKGRKEKKLGVNENREACGRCGIRGVYWYSFIQSREKQQPLRGRGEKRNLGKEDNPNEDQNKGKEGDEGGVDKK